MRSYILAIFIVVACKPISRSLRAVSSGASETSASDSATLTTLKNFIHLRIELPQKSAVAREFELDAATTSENLEKSLLPELGCAKDVNKIQNFDTALPTRATKTEIKAISLTGFAQGDAKLNVDGQFTFTFNLLQYQSLTWELSLSNQNKITVAIPPYFKTLTMTQGKSSSEIWNSELTNPPEAQTVSFSEDLKFSWELTNETKNARVIIFLKSKQGLAACVFDGTKHEGLLAKNFFARWSDPETLLSAQVQNLAVYPSQKILISSYDWRYAIVKP